MLQRTSSFAGCVAANRYAFGGLEGAFAVGLLSFALAGASGSVEAEPFTYPNAGMVGAYRTITPVSIEAEAAGSASLSLSAAGVSNTSALELTYPFAGLISRERGEITISDTTQFEFFLTAVLGASIEPLNSREFELTLSGGLNTAAILALDRKGAGAANLAFAAQGRAGVIGAAALTFTAFGSGVGVGSPFILGAGESQLNFSTTATGARSWPMSPHVTLTFSAQAVSQAESQTTGSTSVTFAAAAASIQDNASAGAASLSFAAAGNAGVTSLAAGQASLQFNAAGLSGGQLANGSIEILGITTTAALRQNTSSVWIG